MKQTEAVMFGMALGAGLMYFLDPQKGARRRALMRDQLTHATHELEDFGKASARHVRNRTIGLAHEARAGISEGRVDDVVLVERVRSEMGRALSHSSAVDVDAHDGHVVLSGNVRSDEVQNLVRTVKSVRGVESVENRLDVHTRTAGISDLQGTETGGDAARTF